MLFRNKATLLCLLGGLLATTACRQDMHNQPRYKPFAATDFFGDGRSARPVIADTVARGQLHIDEARFTGNVDGKDVDAFPIQITRADVERGQQRFNVFCSPCHGRLGNGHGMIVARGLRQPPSYLDQRLVDAPVGHFFDVMTNGYGAMYSYASRVPVDDRWRIASYIRALQLSQGAVPTPAGGTKLPITDTRARRGSPNSGSARKRPASNGYPELWVDSDCCSA